MDLADNVEFRNRLVALAEVFDVKLSPPRQALYFEALRDLPFDRVAHALNDAVQRCKFFPRPVELREFAAGSRDDATEAAWMLFTRALRQVGGYTSLAVPDAALAEAIVALFGSWPIACGQELSPEMWASKRKEFGRVYAVLRDRRLEGARYLPGVCEQQNAGRRDWLKFVPVAVLEPEGIRTLRGADADAYRGVLASHAAGLRQLDAETVVPFRRQGETA